MDNTIRNKYYCELYKLLLDECINTNIEVFGKESPQFCIKYSIPYNNLCK